MSGRTFGNHNVPRTLEDGHPVGIEKLAVPLPNLPELKLEPAFFVENLDLVIVRIGHDDVVLSVDGHATRLSELILQDSKLTKFTVVDHLLPLDVGLGGRRVHEGSQVGWGGEI